MSPLLLALALAAVPGGRPAPPAAVLVISIDALHPDALARW